MRYSYMASFKQYLCQCVTCENQTSKAYARTHNGQCKECVTGVSKQGMLCPDCREHTLTAYQKKNRHHCDSCTREADPVGSYNEMMGYNDEPSY
jgi:hypothetical protein